MLSRWLILMKRTHDNTRKESKSRWKENHEKWRTKDKRQHPSSLITSWPPHGNLQDWKSINNWRHMQLKNRRWIPRAHYCSSFTERDEGWILTQPRHKTSTVVPCNVYKNKLLPHYLHYLTTTYADLAKKSEEAVLNRKVANVIRVHLHHTRRSHEVKFETGLFQVRAWRKKPSTSLI